MAEIVQSLFGVSPEMYQQRQEDQASARAMQFAKLDPFQQANYAIGRGAYGLAGAVGGALGGQDPELQRIAMRQQIASQLNPNDPASIQQAISALMQAGDTQGGMMLQGEYRKMQESGALVGQRNAAAAASMAAAGRERAPATTPDITNARALALLKRTLEELKALPPSPDRDAALRDVENELSNLTNLTAKTPQGGPSFGVDAERFSLELYDKKFADLTPTERAVVNSRVDQSKPRTTITNVMPGDRSLIDIPNFRAKVQDTIAPQSKTVFAADTALASINDSIKTNNFASFRAAQVQFARAISGSGDLSQKELKAAGADPAILGGTADYISSLFTSTPSLATQNKIKLTLEAIKKVSSDKANAEISRQRSIALRNKNYDPSAINEALDFPEFKAAPPPVQYATNPNTKERIMSIDGGKTFTPVR
jgi:hypothetical protein